ncbi:MAG: hypothetical protein Fur0016_25810 [Anaerolineales bacterium]
MTWLLYFAVPLIAFLYASVGFGGATGYLAVMTFFGVPPQVMASTALVLNLLVSAISFFFIFAHSLWVIGRAGGQLLGRNPFQWSGSTPRFGAGHGICHLYFLVGNVEIGKASFIT